MTVQSVFIGVEWWAEIQKVLVFFSGIADGVW